MKNIKSRFNVWIGLLAVCLLPIGAPAAAHYQSGITGLVDEVAMPGVWNVAVFSNSGKWIVNLQTDEQGSFGVDLKPGKYVLTAYYQPHPVPGQPTPNFVIFGPSIPVTVVRGRFTFVVLPTGIHSSGIIGRTVLSKSREIPI